MVKHVATDYETYKEIMSDLLRPISGAGLDDDTLRRLYESKLVYLDNLRQKCFVEINSTKPSHFNTEDHALIIGAIKQTRLHLKEVILFTIMNNLSRRKVC